MTANQMLSKLAFAEVSATYSADTRRAIRDERTALAAAANSKDGPRIAAAMAEAKRVAEMWGVAL